VSNKLKTPAINAYELSFTSHCSGHYLIRNFFFKAGIYFSSPQDQEAPEYHQKSNSTASAAHLPVADIFLRHTPVKLF